LILRVKAARLVRGWGSVSRSDSAHHTVSS
jgi:hypothetical protein